MTTVEFEKGIILDWLLWLAIIVLRLPLTYYCQKETVDLMQWDRNTCDVHIAHSSS